MAPRFVILGLLPRAGARQQEGGNFNSLVGLATGDVNGPDVLVCNSAAYRDSGRLRVTYCLLEQLRYALFDTGAVERRRRDAGGCYIK